MFKERTAVISDPRGCEPRGNVFIKTPHLQQTFFNFLCKIFLRSDHEAEHLPDGATAIFNFSQTLKHIK